MRGDMEVLCVTPSAIIHRVRQLQAYISTKLFGLANFTLTADGFWLLLTPILRPFKPLAPAARCGFESEVQHLSIL
jgi:hypothetical protein